MYINLGLFAGVIGTGIGGLLAYSTKKSGVRFLSSVLEFAAGLMLSVVFLDLLPEGYNALGDIPLLVLCVLIGAMLMFAVEQREYHKSVNKQGDFTVGIIMAISIALHNLPEGLAIGAGFDVSPSLGLSLAITILIHDIPEGIAMAVPFKLSRMPWYKTVAIAMLTGVPTGIGAILGTYISNISHVFIGMCLSLAAGAMLYVVLCDLIPHSKKMYTGRLSGFFNIFGVIAGIILALSL